MPIAVLLLSLGGWLAPSIVRAEAKPQPNTDEIIIEFWGLKGDTTTAAPGLEEPGRRNEYWEQISVFGQATAPIAEQEYFNQARCTCTDKNLVRIAIRRNPGVLTDFDGDVEIFAGERCENKDDQNFDQRCTKVVPGSFKLRDIETSEKVIFVDTKLLMDPVNGNCSPVESVGTIWLLVVNRGGAGTSTVAFESHKDFDVDTQPPPAVTNFTARPSENGIYLDWEVSDSSVEDVWYYQVLCTLVATGGPLDPTPPEPDFQQACALPSTPPTGDAGPAADAAPASEPFDPTYICAEGSRGSSSLLVGISEALMLNRNDLIEVQLLVMDKHRNVVATQPLVSHLEPVQDFWEVYDDLGGGAEGGYCFVATAAYGDYDHPFVLVLRDFRDHTLARFAAGRAFIDWYYRSSPGAADFIRENALARLGAQIALWPVVFLAGTWEYTTAFDKVVLFALLAFAVIWRRRRKHARRASLATGTEKETQMQTGMEPAVVSTRGKRTIAAVAASLAVLLGGVHAASAQAIYEDDWDQPVAPPVSQWAVEIKLGPYTPDIDGEAAATDGGRGPYERTFGDAGGGGTDALMTGLEIDRFFLFPGGQLGLAVGASYMQKWASAFQEDPVTGDPLYDQPRSGDRTTFRLVPIYVGAVYRYTQIADRTVVPIVPYGKLGLAYDLWWITKGNGDISSTASKGDAKGGTLGWQGTLGLSLRADAIDPGAARNMQIEMGVEHVGFFAEVTYADVSGLGQSRRLHVGDLTWAAGINFEF